MAQHNTAQPDKAKQRLKALEAKEKKRLKLAGALATLSSLAFIAQAWMAAEAIGQMTAGTVAFDSIFLPALLFLLIGLGRHGLDYVSGRLAFNAAQAIISSERKALLQHLAKQAPLSPNRLSSATAANLLGEKLDLLLPLFTRYNIASQRVRIVPLVILAVLLSQSWMAALILLISGPLIPLFMALVGMHARDLSQKQLQETGTLNGLLLERLNAMADICLLNARKTMLGQFENHALSLKERTMAVLRIAFLSSTVLELFSALGVAMMAVYVGFSLLGSIHIGTWHGSLSLTIGTWALLLAPEFFAPLRDLAAGWHDRASALALAGELLEVESAQTLDVLGTGASALALQGPISIETQDLTFVHPDGHALHYPDMVIAQGDTIAVNGPSGVGKTVLLHLLAGLLPLSTGAIKVNGQRLSAENADAWRANIAWISQKPHFLEQSLLANLVPDAAHYDWARLAKALDVAGASDIVARLPRGLQTRLGETGNQVSGGEARRLMIARALYSHATVIFADEPTADLDRENAQNVANALLTLAKYGRTLVVATHDQHLIALLGKRVSLEVAA